MRIALLVPPITLVERYNKALARVTGSLPPLGLLSIGTILKERGHDVVVLDGTILSFPEVLSRVEDFRPELIGITAMTMMWPKVKILSRRLKEIVPLAKIIVGGIHASLIRERAFGEIPEIDAISYGEGDFSMLEFVEALNSLDAVSSIDGIAFKRQDGSLVIGPDRRPIPDLDVLPIPDRSLVPVTSYTGAFHQHKVLPVTNMITSRGCPFRCLFCIPDLLGKGVRYRSVDRVIEEIEYLLRDFGVRDIAIFDDTFTLNKKRVLSICKKIRERKLHFVWSANARADCVDREMLDRMAEAGCWKLFYGVESLVQKNLDSLQKDQTVEEIFRAIRWTKMAGIEVEASFIFGIPGETYADGLETIKLALKLDADYAKFFPLSPYGGRLLSEVDQYGTLLTDDESDFSANKITFIPFTMTKEELRRLYFKAYRRFYFRPKIFFRQLKKIGRGYELKKSFQGVAALMTFILDEIAEMISAIEFFPF